MIDIIEITKASMTHTFSTNGIAIITAIKPTLANYQLDRANGVSSNITKRSISSIPCWIWIYTMYR